MNAEAEYNAWKLLCVSGGQETKLLVPPEPYEWSADGEHDSEILMMPLTYMEEIRRRFTAFFHAEQ